MTQPLPLVVAGLACAAVAAVTIVGTARKRTAASGPTRPLIGMNGLRQFQLEEVLKNEDDGRNVILLGRFQWQPEGEKAIVKLQAVALSLQGLLTQLNHLVAKLKSESGAEYAFYDFTPTSWMSLVKGVGVRYTGEVIAPASERTIQRSRPVENEMVTESPELYQAVTLGFAEEAASEKGLSWLYNVLSKEKEVERILYEDPDPEHGFILNVDTKWKKHPDCKEVPREQWKGHPSLGDLYCLAICHKRGIRSLRDLRAEHLPMLRNVYRRGVETIESVYGISEGQLRVFVHYLPQFWHFHVHFTRQSNDFGVQTERAHLLLDIIQNLESDNLYYTKRTIQYRLRVNDKLYAKIKGHEEEDGSSK